jgi:predicted amidophosphoribosyltransferase
MKMRINPTEIRGIWDKGYVLDRHVLKATPKGENVYGHMEFDTTRTELGELLYLFKSQGRYDCLYEIMELISPFLDTWEDLKEVDIVLPVPSTKPRNYQPAVEIAQAIAKHINVSFLDGVLENISSIQAKNIAKADRTMDGCIIANVKATRPHTILLIDDLIDTGSTMRECVSVLRDDKKLKRIYVLAMTRTRGDS